MLNQAHLHNPKTISQYTWLKDKEWKEIYEWDIIKLWKQIFEITFRWWKFVPTYIDWSWDEIEDSRWYNNIIEIIWNIYENPELLNK